MNKVHVDIAGGVIIFFLSLFLYTKFIGPIPFSIDSVTTNKINLFQAQGTGQVTAIPNTAEVSLGVTKTAATVADAQNQVNTTTQNILDSLKNLGVDAKDITTTNYSLNPQYDYTSGQKVTGYTVTQNIDVKLTPIDKANKAVDAATADGANIVGGITFTVDDATKKSLEDKARKMAVDDAKQKAQSLANAAGIHLGRVIDIQETTDQPIIRPLLMNAGGGSMAKIDQTTTQLPVGQSTITSNVTISYETY